MRGTDEASGSLYSFVDLEERIPARHPLRRIRQVVNDALASLDAKFEALYTDFGRPSVPSERLIRASLIQILFSIRSPRRRAFDTTRQLTEQIQYNLLFRFFVGVGIDDPVWDEGCPENCPVDRFQAKAGDMPADDDPGSPTGPGSPAEVHPEPGQCRASMGGGGSENGPGDSLPDDGDDGEPRGTRHGPPPHPGSTQRLTLGVKFVADLRQACVTPHIAQKSRYSAIDGRTTRREGYALSIKHRKQIAEAFG
ncbi:hypothetical protein ROE7235_03155 [Roseibaca ekhonensis]|jgi:hypothetical protein|uniref:Transposase InsH N-terminal domain-containing protein n=1 Tax=Roseinatronobacter ekhonensis TaxID=254356 RepID=A0A3B0MBT8_9RHOB|nr:hypothetical protein ROE7235_03155 [Roseibaca ekhonensis]